MHFMCNDEKAQAMEKAKPVNQKRTLTWCLKAQKEGSCSEGAKVIKQKKKKNKSIRIIKGEQGKEKFFFPEAIVNLYVKTDGKSST